MITPSTSAADQRGMGSPSDSSASPEEEMSSTAPPTSPSTATSANGTRNQVGSRAASAPIGSAAMALDRSVDEPASSSPNTSSTSGAIEAPNVVQPTTPPDDAVRGR